MVWLFRAYMMIILIEALLVAIIGFAWIIRITWNEFVEWENYEGKSIAKSKKAKRSKV